MFYFLSYFLIEFSTEQSEYDATLTTNFASIYSSFKPGNNTLLFDYDNSNLK